ncbi:MAG: hypothetical protein AAGA15_07220 [Pseudomonadota bacterium]
MRFDDTKSFLKGGRATLAKGPVALIFVEDDVEVAATINHHLLAGFKSVVGFMAPDIDLDEELAHGIIRVDWDITHGDAVFDIVNACINAAPGTWLYYCYNAEFLFFPFSETRNVAELVAFNVEERRDSILTYVVDLYANNLYENPSAVSLEDAWMDRSGYYALQRTDEWNNPIDRQMDFYGGLRWRLEEHIPAKRRRIDRIAIFRAAPGLELREDHTFNDPEYNTYACPWHHSITATICSFRTAKALKRNPGSTFDIDTFRWHNSIKFDWSSRQLMGFGLMEPGQWF